MIDAEVSARIRRLFHAEHWKIGTIAAQLDVHRDVVVRVLAVDRFVSNGRVVPSALDAFIPFIEDTLKQYPTLRATRIHEMVAARGYRGSAVQTRRLVARLRPRRRAEVFLRLETLPGAEAQVDWGSFGHVTIGKARRPLSAFVMVLSWSRALHVVFTLDQTLESFLRGHVESFAFLGGVPRRILYDNLKSAVLERHGDGVRFNPRLLDFAGHYAFEPRPVAIARGNEKGKVERSIRFLRDRFFAARPFRDIDDLNRQLVMWRDEWAHARPCPGDESITVATAFERERPMLLGMPEHTFETDALRPVVARKTPYVRFDANDYTIPHSLVGKPLTLLASASVVRVVDGANEVARHQRSYDRGVRIEDDRHIRGLVDEKRAARQPTSMSRLVHAVPAIAPFLQETLQRGLSVGRSVQQLEALLDLYGPAELAAAIDEVFARGSVEPSAVTIVVERRRNKSRRAPPIATPLPDDPRVRDLRVTPHNLESYDDLADDDE